MQDHDELLARLETLENSVRAHSEESRGVWDNFSQQLGTMNDRQQRMNGNVSRIIAEIGPGFPSVDERGERETLRGRLHELEESKNAAHATSIALGLIFGKVSKFIMVGGVIIAAVGTILRMFGVGA